MTLAELDATIARLRAAAEQIGANMLEFERDATREMLDLAVLEGETAARWVDAATAWPDLWSWLTKLTVVLDEAVTLRGNRGWLNPDRQDKLRDLLAGESIELARADVPILDRDILGARQSTTHCTPDALLELMARTFDRIRGLVATVARAWDELVPRVSVLGGELDGLVNAPSALDDDIASEIARFRPRLDDLGRALMADPMSVAPAAVDDLDHELARVKKELLASRELRDEFEDRLAHARALRAQASTAVAGARAAHDEVLTKIAQPSVPVPATLPAEVDQQLARVEQLASDGRWRGAQTELTTWLESIAAVIQRADADTAANRAPLEGRNRLRGQLDGYQAKAQARGLLEVDEVMAHYSDARDALYTAPTDLTRAAECLRAYRRSIDEAHGHHEEGGRNELR